VQRCVTTVVSACRGGDAEDTKRIGRHAARHDKRVSVCARVFTLLSGVDALAIRWSSRSWRTWLQMSLSSSSIFMRYDIAMPCFDWSDFDSIEEITRHDDLCQTG
jgi:hypothetical protein